MRSWIKDPILLKNKEDLGIVFLFKTMQVMNDLVTAIANAEIDFGTNSIYG